jgi:hypothetical protein
VSCKSEPAAALRPYLTWHCSVADARYERRPRNDFLTGGIA